MKILKGMPDEKQYIQSFFNQGEHSNDVIFDVGCNLGRFAENVFLLSPDSNVFGFEPIEELQGYLNKKFDKENFALFEFGLSDEEGLREYYVPPRAKECSSLYFRKEFPGEKRNIFVSTLDNVMDAGIVDHIDYLKIDVEGHEYSVLLGAMETIRAGKITNIQFEYGECYPLAGVELNQVIRLLYPFYTIFHPDFGYLDEDFNLSDGIVRNFLAEKR